MDFKKLKEFIDIAREAGACELQMHEGDKKYSVSFPTASAPMMVAQQPVMAATTAQPSTGTSSGSSSSKSAGLVEVTSPFVGTFYTAPSPDSPIYAKKGDRVTKGQTLCIVEAMKIMNEIESEASGEVVEVCVENESYVEYGQVLFKIRP